MSLLNSIVVSSIYGVSELELELEFEIEFDWIECIYALGQQRAYLHLFVVVTKEDI